MHGELMWFNESRQDGMIRIDDGRRVPVAGAAFPDGTGPVGRCGGIRVAFDVVDADGGPHAVAVSYLPAEAARRARSRGRR